MITVGDCSFDFEIFLVYMTAFKLILVYFYVGFKSLLVYMLPAFCFQSTAFQSTHSVACFVEGAAVTMYSDENAVS